MANLTGVTGLCREDGSFSSWMPTKAGFRHVGRPWGRGGSWTLRVTALCATQHPAQQLGSVSGRYCAFALFSTSPDSQREIVSSMLGSADTRRPGERAIRLLLLSQTLIPFGTVRIHSVYSHCVSALFRKERVQQADDAK